MTFLSCDRDNSLMKSMKMSAYILLGIGEGHYRDTSNHVCNVGTITTFNEVFYCYSYV